MTRTKQLVGVGLAVMMVGVVVWVMAGCGGGEMASAAGNIEPTGATGARAPIVADAAGMAKVIIGFKQRPGHSQRGLVEGQGGKVKYMYTIIPAIAATLPEKAVAALQRNPNVAYVEGVAQAELLNDELPWGADRIDADIVWGGAEDAVDIAGGGPTGAGVNVAIIDSGIDYNHLDLDDNYGGGYDFADWDDPVNPNTDPMDYHGHGTHCAGIVAAEDDGVGIIQVAPGASLYALKVFADGSDGAWYDDIIAALQWCITEEMDVASMSFEGPEDTSLREACAAAYAANVLLVAAAGNSGNPAGRGDNVLAPAMYESVIAVAATDINDRRARFSSTGPDVELAAPGVDIKSTVPGGYAVWSGTSMACPHVAGVAALVIESGISGAAAVRDQLNQTAETVGDGNPDYYGSGLVDAEAAVGIPPNEPPTVTIMSPADGSPFDSGASILFEGTASDPEDGDLTAGLVWTSNIGGEIGTGGSFSATLSDGTHTITAEVTDSGGKPGTDSITITVGAAPVGTGAITGKVTDETTGRGLAGATVITDTGQESAPTNRSGKYTIADVPVGLRNVTASASGYANQEQNVEIVAGQTTTLNFTLTPTG